MQDEIQCGRIYKEGTRKTPQFMPNAGWRESWLLEDLHNTGLTRSLSDEGATQGLLFAAV
jgi:hypothetical protein